MRRQRLNDLIELMRERMFGSIAFVEDLANEEACLRETIAREGLGFMVHIHADHAARTYDVSVADQQGDG